MRAARSREDRKQALQHLVPTQEDLKRELENQVAEKRKMNLIQEMQDQEQLLKHYENYKVGNKGGADHSERELEELINRKKQQINNFSKELGDFDPKFNEMKEMVIKRQQKGLSSELAAKLAQAQEEDAKYQDAFYQNMNKHKSASELEREARLKLREEERLRRLNGVKVSAYDEPKAFDPVFGAKAEKDPFGFERNKQQVAVNQQYSNNNLNNAFNNNIPNDFSSFKKNDFYQDQPIEDRFNIKSSLEQRKNANRAQPTQGEAAFPGQSLDSPQQKFKKRPETPSKLGPLPQLTNFSPNQNVVVNNYMSNKVNSNIFAAQEKATPVPNAKIQRSNSNIVDPNELQREKQRKYKEELDKQMQQKMVGKQQNDLTPRVESKNEKQRGLQANRVTEEPTLFDRLGEGPRVERGVVRAAADLNDEKYFEQEKKRMYADELAKQIFNKNKQKPSEQVYSEEFEQKNYFSNGANNVVGAGGYANPNARAMEENYYSEQQQQQKNFVIKKTAASRSTQEDEKQRDLEKKKKYREELNKQMEEKKKLRPHSSKIGASAQENDQENYRGVILTGQDDYQGQAYEEMNYNFNGRTPQNGDGQRKERNNFRQNSMKAEDPVEDELKNKKKIDYQNELKRQMEENQNRKKQEQQKKREEDLREKERIEKEIQKMQGKEQQAESKGRKRFQPGEAQVPAGGKGANDNRSGVGVSKEISVPNTQPFPSEEEYGRRRAPKNNLNIYDSSPNDKAQGDFNENQSNDVSGFGYGNNFESRGPQLPSGAQLQSPMAGNFVNNLYSQDPRGVAPFLAVNPYQIQANQLQQQLYEQNLLLQIKSEKQNLTKIQQEEFEMLNEYKEKVKEIQEQKKRYDQEIDRLRGILFDKDNNLDKNLINMFLAGNQGQQLMFNMNNMAPAMPGMYRGGPPGAGADYFEVLKSLAAPNPYNYHQNPLLLQNPLMAAASNPLLLLLQQQQQPQNFPLQQPTFSLQQQQSFPLQQQQSFPQSFPLQQQQSFPLQQQQSFPLQQQQNFPLQPLSPTSAFGGPFQPQMPALGKPLVSQQSLAQLQQNQSNSSLLPANVEEKSRKNQFRDETPEMIPEKTAPKSTKEKLEYLNDYAAKLGPSSFWATLRASIDLNKSLPSNTNYVLEENAQELLDMTFKRDLEKLKEMHKEKFLSEEQKSEIDEIYGRKEESKLQDSQRGGSKLVDKTENLAMADSNVLASIIPKGLEYKLISTNDYSYLQKKDAENARDEEPVPKSRKKNIYMEEGRKMIESSENKLLTSDVISSLENERLRKELSQKKEELTNVSKKQQRAGRGPTQETDPLSNYKSKAEDLIDEKRIHTEFENRLRTEHSDDIEEKLEFEDGAEDEDPGKYFKKKGHQIQGRKIENSIGQDEQSLVFAEDELDEERLEKFIESNNNELDFITKENHRAQSANVNTTKGKENNWTGTNVSASNPTSNTNNMSLNTLENRGEKKYKGPKTFDVFGKIASLNHQSSAKSVNNKEKKELILNRLDQLISDLNVDYDKEGRDYDYGELDFGFGENPLGNFSPYGEQPPKKELLADFLKLNDREPKVHSQRYYDEND